MVKCAYNDLVRTLWLVVILWLVPTTGAARPRVAVMPFRGDEAVAAKAEASLVALLETDADVASEKATWTAMDKLGIRKATDRSMRDLADLMKVDAVIAGDVKKRGPNTELTLLVRRRGSPQVAEIRTVYRVFSGVDAELRDRISDAIRERKPDPAQPLDDGSATHADDSPSRLDDARPTEFAVAGAARLVRGLGRSLLQIRGGGAAVGRTLSFSTRAGFVETPPGYTSTLIGAVHVDLSLHPFSASRSFIAGLGFIGDFDRTVGLTTSTSAAPTIRMPTVQQNWRAGIEYRYGIGADVDPTTLSLDVGYGSMAFVVNRSGLPAGTELDMPDTDYRYVDAGIGGRIPLGPVALSMGARGLFTNAAGGITALTQYGGATIRGFGGRAGMDATFGKLVVGLTADYTTLSLRFDGTGDQTKARDGDVNTIDVTAANDSLLRVMATVGYWM